MCPSGLDAGAGRAPRSEGADSGRPSGALLTRIAARLRRSLGGLADTLDPTPLRARRLLNSIACEGGLVCVYRSRNRAFVERLVRQAEELRLAVALWALDAPVPGLARMTIGRGPGARVGLLNRLCEAIPSSTGPLVISDDDVEFTRGNLGQLLSVASRCGFGIAQPAHAPSSHWLHDITTRWSLTLARLTTFVEIGPVVVVDARWRSSILPFPEDFGMGWGLDLLWQDLQREGCRLGIVDAVCIRQTAPTGAAYDPTPERERLRSLMEARSIERLSDIQRSLAAWRVWQREPPW